MIQSSKKHLTEANKEYISHGKFAVMAGLDLIVTGIASIIHGFIPALLPFYAEKKVDFYYKKSLQLQQNRKKSGRKPKLDIQK